MKRKISVTVFIYFAASLAIFALITSGIFSTLFQKHARELNVNQLTESSINVAQTVSGIWEKQETADTTSSSGHMRASSRNQRKSSNGMMQHHSSSSELQTYVDFMKDSALADIWIIDENLAIATSQPQDNLQLSDLPTEAVDIITAAFLGDTVHSEALSDYLGQETITVGTPIFAEDGQVIGAVFSHAPVNDFNHTLMSGLETLGLSLFFALPVAALLSWFLSQKLTKPIKQMNTTTQELKNGDYTMRTNIQRGDELGEVAYAINNLAIQLESADAAQQALEKMRQTFITNISHELRTPVTVMRSSLEALHDKVVVEPTVVAKYHEKLLHESIYLQQLVNDLLELSKLQSFDFSIERVPINMYDVLTDLKRSMQQLADARGIVITLDDRIKEINYNADYTRCRQMFITVLDNALKFSEPGTTVTIEVQETDIATAIKITDQGQGIPEEQLATLFDRFHRSTNEQNKQGSGLGLAIAKEIANRHDITIDVTSSASGTCFTFTLPKNKI